MGKLFVISGASGVGKGTVVKKVMEQRKDLSFSVYVYNNQPGIVIDYKTGESYLAENAPDIDDSEESNPTEEVTGEIDGNFILNASKKTIHKEGCRSVSLMSEKNKIFYTGLYSELITNGYHPCGNCNPSEIFEEDAS